MGSRLLPTSGDIRGGWLWPRKPTLPAREPQTRTPQELRTRSANSARWEAGVNEKPKPFPAHTPWFRRVFLVTLTRAISLIRGSGWHSTMASPSPRGSLPPKNSALGPRYPRRWAGCAGEQGPGWRLVQKQRRDPARLPVEGPGEAGSSHGLLTAPTAMCGLVRQDNGPDSRK